MAEVEVKAKVTNFKNIEKKLHEIGCVLSLPITQNDTLYIRTGLKYENVNRDHTPVLRIRREQDKVTLNLKYNRTTEMDMIEYEVIINDPKEMEAMLQTMDYYAVMQFTKVRRKGKFQHYEICLDEVAGLGSFIEVEKITEEDGESTQKELMQFLLSLGINETDRVIHGYDTLMLKKATSR